ncbi:hypothetical protein BGM25_09945 [Bacillus sp. FJAT-29953]|nr:hypothetical protein [Bacillus sp. FJAT-29953]
MDSFQILPEAFLAGLFGQKGALFLPPARLQLLFGQNKAAIFTAGPLATPLRAK